MSDELKLRSSIHTPLMKSVLMKGSFLAAIGVSLLAYGGIFMPVQELNIWGFPLFMIGGGLITAGLLPYRRLRSLERKPDELILDNESLQFISKGVTCLTIPLKSIARTAYIEQKLNYGIGVWFKSPLPAQVIVHNNKFSLKKLHGTHKTYDCNLFFPYFSERSYNQLREIYYSPD
jgi:hypothetical protein